MLIELDGQVEPTTVLFIMCCITINNDLLDNEAQLFENRLSFQQSDNPVNKRKFTQNGLETIDVNVGDW